MLYEPTDVFNDRRAILAEDRENERRTKTAHREQRCRKHNIKVSQSKTVCVKLCFDSEQMIEVEFVATCLFLCFSLSENSFYLPSRLGPLAFPT